jgi:hypothetical protein
MFPGKGTAVIRPFENDKFSPIVGQLAGLTKRVSSNEVWGILADSRSMSDGEREEH